MATLRSKLQSHLDKSKNNRKRKGKGKGKRSRHSSDEDDSDSNSEEDAHDSLLSFLTAATKTKGNGKGKKGRLGMTVLVNSNSCSDSSSHASVLETYSLSRSLRSGSVGDMSVSHPTTNTSGRDNATVDGYAMRVSALDASSLTRSPNVEDVGSNTSTLTSGRVMGLVERNVSAAKEATTKGNEDGGSVRCMAELHSKGVSGWDTDASRAVTTYPQHIIPSLLDRSKSAVQSISFSSAAGTNSVLGFGPMARATLDTEDGKAYWVIEPDAVLMDSGVGGNDMSVYGAQSMKKLGLALQQCYKNTDRDVVVCRKTNRVVNLSEESGILVLRTMRKQATDLSRMQGIEDLVRDIRDGLISPLVPCSLKIYRSKNSNSSSAQLTLHAQFEKRGKGSEDRSN